MLFSATATKKVEEITKLALKKEPMYIGVDDSKDAATRDGLEQGKHKSSTYANYSMLKSVTSQVLNLVLKFLRLCSVSCRQTIPVLVYFLEEKSQEESDGLFELVYGC